MKKETKKPSKKAAKKSKVNKPKTRKGKRKRPILLIIQGSAPDGSSFAQSREITEDEKISLIGSDIIHDGYPYLVINTHYATAGVFDLVVLLLESKSNQLTTFKF